MGAPSHSPCPTKTTELSVIMAVARHRSCPHREDANSSDRHAARSTRWSGTVHSVAAPFPAGHAALASSSRLQNQVARPAEISRGLCEAQRLRRRPATVNDTITSAGWIWNGASDKVHQGCPSVLYHATSPFDDDPEVPPSLAGDDPSPPARLDISPRAVAEHHVVRSRSTHIRP